MVDRTGCCYPGTLFDSPARYRLNGLGRRDTPEVVGVDPCFGVAGLTCVNGRVAKSYRDEFLATGIEAPK